MRILVLAGVWLAATVGARACQTARPVEAWACAELAFTAAADYGHPIREVALRVAFTHPSGDTLSVGGFWDGGRTWRARAAFPRAGAWTWASRSSDAGLNGQSGTVDVVGATGTDPYRTRGWLRVSGDRRHLTYGDGTPFFYLADTAWEAGWAAPPAAFETYLADRQAKGFDVVQIVVSTHQYNYPDLITNQAGQPYLSGTDRSRLNPRYFDSIDALVRRANESGMAVALVPLWGTYSAAHAASTNHITLVSLDEALVQAAYIGARYAGSNVVWIVGGDQYYNTEERRAYWDAFARRLRAASGSRHLMTVHPGGYSGSYAFWPVAPDWLDFHMYQGSHYDSPWYVTGDDGVRVEDAYGALRANGGFSWEGALQGYHQADPRPVLNAEANYEDLFGR
ncbi:MAG TPA: DUF5060 domain-containing protein, partial [Rubricoccaceae bacterium]